MNITAVYHEPKSRYAYAYDKDTLHVRIRTAKDDIDKIDLIWGDQFNHMECRPGSGNWIWNHREAETLEMKKEYTDEFYDYWFVEFRAEWHRVRYVFVLQDGENEILYGSRFKYDLKKNEEKRYGVYNYFNFPFINQEDIHDGPEWVKETVWYQIFAERFCNGDPSLNRDGILEWGSKKTVNNDMIFGGDLKGIQEKLDYLIEMGITGIYFTPIFDAPSTHKYDTEDYFNIDSSFGDNGAFKQLVEEAHKRGIKVMLDAVFNHCGWTHPFWLDVVENGKESKYYDCFFIKNDPVVNFDLWDGKPASRPKSADGRLNYETFAFTTEMPKWNTDHPIVNEHLLEAAKYWVKEYNIDGWRLDVSNEVSHKFWREFKTAVREIKPDLFILGENWDNSYPWLQGDQFDATMNFDFMFGIWDFVGSEGFNHETVNAVGFKNIISHLLVNYPKNVSPFMFNLIDCHDTPRILSVCNNNVDKVKLAYVLQMTFTGSPSIYYGSEIGLPGVGDDNRKCMIWDENKQNVSLKNHVKQLIALRKNNPAFRAVDIQWLYAGEEDNCLIYKKETEGQQVYVIINNGEKDAVIDLPQEMMNVDFEDIYNEKNVQLNNSININPGGFVILKKKR